MLTILSSNALRVSFQIASVLVGILMRYTKRSQIFVLIGVPIVVLGQGLQIYFTNKNGDGPASEVCFITAKTLVGVGRAFYQTAAQVSIQGIVEREDVPIVTSVYYAAMSFGAAIGTRYVLKMPILDNYSNCKVSNRVKIVLVAPSGIVSSPESSKLTSQAR